MYLNIKYIYLKAKTFYNFLDKHSMSLVAGVSWLASQAANPPTNTSEVGPG
jgi:hypothetical protein